MITKWKPEICWKIWKRSRNNLKGRRLDRFLMLYDAMKSLFLSGIKRRRVKLMKIQPWSRCMRTKTLPKWLSLNILKVTYSELIAHPLYKAQFENDFLFSFLLILDCYWFLTVINHFIEAINFFKIKSICFRLHQIGVVK